MAAIRITPFLGMLPRTAPRLLPEGAAVEATNVDLTSGEIIPIRRKNLVNTPSVAGPWLAVYRAEYNGAEVWLAWPRDVDVVRAPLPSTVEPRFYWAGDGEPRYAKYSGLPATFFAMGVPRPKAAPTVTPSGGTGAATTRVYVYTFYSALDEESGESPASALTTGKVDDSWAIAGMDAFPANSGTGSVSFAGGVSTFTNTGNHWLRVGDEVVISGTTVAVSEVTSNSVYKVPGNFAGATTWARKAPWNTTGMKRRLYRSAGSTGSYQLVNDNVGTSYSDTLTDSQILGDELISQGWEPPPPGLRGLIVLPNGAMVGFLDNEVRYSEPLQFHAWPDSYRRRCDFPVVGIEAYGTTVVACTASVPYVLSGVEPASVTPESVQQVWPCLSKRGVISVGDGVLYPTSYGLAYIGLRGAFIWTEAFYGRADWRPLNPETMVAAVTEGRVYLRYEADDGGRGVLMFEPDGGSIRLTSLSAFPDELYADARNGLLYLVDALGIYQFDASDGLRENYAWRSRDYHLGKMVNLGAAKVDFASEMTAADSAKAQADYDAAIAANAALVAGYTGFGALNGAGGGVNETRVDGSSIQGLPEVASDSVTFTLYSKGLAVYSTKLFADDRAFRLPAGFRTDVLAVGLSGTARVNAVKLAETMAGLSQV